MRYYKLADDVTVPGRWHLSTVETLDGHEPPLGDGVPASSAPIKAKVTQPGKELDFCITSFAVPVARSSLGAAIEAIVNGGECQPSCRLF